MTAFLQPVTVQTLQAPITTTATFTTPYLDFQGSINPGGHQVKFFAQANTVSGTTPSFSCQLQGCNTTNGTYVNVGSPVVITTTAGTAGFQQTHVVTIYRYHQVVVTTSGTTPSAVLSLFALTNAIIT